ncbi:MAG: CDP-alcohol phosphatidyltransferase family protein [Bacteroidota bacterium]|nr:CDP-alcohol phosphatidyltransferase family protein [Bacteroidota bacterium]
MLSLSRIVLMIPAVYFLYTPMHFHREIAVFIVLVAMITDALDGYLARMLHQISNLGKIIDPLADKIGVGIVVVMLTFYGDIPLWFTIVVLSRDIIIFLAGLYIKTKTGIILQSMMSGKIAVATLAFTIVLAMLKYPFFEKLYEGLIVVTVLLLGVSLSVYTKRFFITLQRNKTRV